MQNVLITGGAGFIGSHIVKKLLKNKVNVRVIDNFSTGHKLFINEHLKNPRFQLIQADIANKKLLSKAINGSDFVFHLAAHADVRSGYKDHFVDHEQNLEMTQYVLEAMVENGVKNICFSSTSGVYGDPQIHPTPENCELRPTSLYGATKAACESYIHAYASYYGFRSYIFRFVSFLGEHYTHGIIFDVLKKMKANQTKIELFSDGSPRKSSLYVGDGVDAIFKVINKSKDQVNIYNLGHDQVLTVRHIVDIIINSSGHTNIKKVWLGKESNWKGDNEYVHLDNSKIKGLGWKPKLSIKQGIERTVIYLEKHPELFKNQK